MTGWCRTYREMRKNRSTLNSRKIQQNRKFRGIKKDPCKILQGKKRQRISENAADAYAEPPLYRILPGYLSYVREKSWTMRISNMCFTSEREERKSSGSMNKQDHGHFKSPLIPMVTTFSGISFPLAATACFTAYSRPPQHGTSIRVRVMLRIAFLANSSVSFSE